MNLVLVLNEFHRHPNDSLTAPRFTLGVGGVRRCLDIQPLAGGLQYKRFGVLQCVDLVSERGAELTSL